VSTIFLICSSTAASFLTNPRVESRRIPRMTSWISTALCGETTRAPKSINPMADSRRFKVEGAVPRLASAAKNIASVAGAAGSEDKSIA